MRELWPLLLGAGLAFAESGLGLGMVVPGETGVLVLAASLSSVQLAVGLGVCVAMGACAGDHLGYLVGRRSGDRLRSSRLVVRIGQRHYDRAVEVLRRRGAAAVFWTRLVPVVRTVTPAVAGISQLPYRAFLPASMAGSSLWATVYVGGGSTAGAAVSAAGDVLGGVTWIAVAVVATIVVPLALVRSVVPVRPRSTAPDVAALERAATGPRARRAAFSPLIGELQV